MCTCSPRSSSRETRGASTAARTRAPQNSATFALQIVHRAKNFRHIPAGHRGPANSTSCVSPRCVVVNKSRNLKGSRICTHVFMKSFAGCAVRDLRLGRKRWTCRWSSSRVSCPARSCNRQRPELTDGCLELVIEKGSRARALCEGLPPLLDGLRQRAVRLWSQRPQTFLLLLLLRVQVAKAADMKIFDQIWQKNEFRITDFSETVALISMA